MRLYWSQFRALSMQISQKWTLEKQIYTLWMPSKLLFFILRPKKALALLYTRNHKRHREMKKMLPLIKRKHFLHFWKDLKDSCNSRKIHSLSEKFHGKFHLKNQMWHLTILWSMQQRFLVWNLQWNSPVRQ